ncbi:MAG: hypothetical protein Q8912_06075 [Bacillota bacterium]|nr:hypothetical protein [Bacillota bacterium]MDP4159478.1 hypothetical protein [Bacillota bacterium]
MQKLYKALWSLAILVIIVTALMFSLGVILIGVMAASVFGVYRYYLAKRRLRVYNMKPYTSGEVIDVKPM